MTRHFRVGSRAPEESPLPVGSQTPHVGSDQPHVGSRYLGAVSIVSIALGRPVVEPPERSAPGES
jgi:hypothetical protein